ncbi:hypothetical protein [Streptomyces sp. cmx-4-9]|uniref:hypothetical protein n=1 Tax=Streptomyces sp. cmx-4-9 TaxID=2790941 RepID=UPI00397F4AF8
MGNTLLALAVALVGVTGTLLAPVLSQRLVARIQSQQFEREERLGELRWQREQRVAEQAARRACYVTANAGYRRYRQELMLFLWLVRKGEDTARGRSDLEDARRGMHAAFAEAQMTASDAVLAELDGMTRALAGTYARVLRLEEGDPYQDGSFEDIHAELLALRERWERMRDAMRADLGVTGR